MFAKTAAGAALLACMMVLSGGLGAEEDRVAELRALVEQERFSEAYELGRSLQSEYEGEPRFDFQFALAAIEMGAFSEGVFALERVLMNHPGSQRTRLELARAYFLMQENSQARREFERVLAQEPPEQVRNTVERYLIAIQRRESRYEPIISYWVEGGLGYDNNVNNSAGGTVEIDTLFGPQSLELDDAESDSFMEVKAGGDVLAPLDEHLALFGRGRVSQRNHGSENDYDNRRLRVDGGVQWVEGPLQVRAGLDLQRYWLDNEVYQDQTGLQGSGRYRLNPQWDATGFMRLSQFKYPDLKSRDSQMWMVGGGASTQLPLPWQPVLTGSLFIGQETPRRTTNEAKATADRQLTGVQLGGQATVAPEVVVRGSLQYAQSEYAEGQDYVLFEFDARKEQLLSMELSADWRPLAQWTVTPTLIFSDNKANEDIYEYERTQFFVKARYTFD